MTKQKEIMTFVCPKCGKKASLWKHSDDCQYAVTCSFCNETTGFVDGMLAAVDNWKSGRTHEGRKVESPIMRFCCNFKNRG